MNENTNEIKYRIIKHIDDYHDTSNILTTDADTFRLDIIPALTARCDVSGLSISQVLRYGVINVYITN